MAGDWTSDPDNSGIEKIEDLTDEEQDLVRKAIDVIQNRRVTDASKGIFDRLTQAMKFVKKKTEAMSTAYYNC